MLLQQQLSSCQHVSTCRRNIPFQSCPGRTLRRARAVSHKKNLAFITRAAEAESFGDSLKRIAKKVQGSLPIIGLISRLTAPSGGFDELSYGEFSRSMYEAGNQDFNIALEDFEKLHGQSANSRWVLLMLWMSKCAPGLVGVKEVINAARRLRVTNDMEVEMDRFEGGRTTSLQKYMMVERPAPKLQEQLNLAVDTLATCCIGLKEGVALKEESRVLIAALLQIVFPEAADAQIQEALDGRPQRIVGFS